MNPVRGKSPWLTLHVAEPLQAETPVVLLRQHRVTPVPYLYVRNNQDLEGSMHLGPGEQNGSLTLRAGELAKAFTLDALRGYPQTDVEMVLQCSGNARSYFGGSSPVSGAPWQDGAIANVVFSGVRLKDLLETDPTLKRAANTPFVSALGAGTHEDSVPDFGRSVPTQDVLESALLALDLNGEALPALHGGPLRLVLPGYYGVNQVKWLRALHFEPSPLEAHYQLDKYRLPKERLAPGHPFEATAENSRPSWRINLRSMLWQPLVGDHLRAGFHTFSGVAWTDGRSRVERVELSLDAGASWQNAALEHPASPYAWSLWSLTLALEAGEPEIWVRAHDDAGHTQPLDPDEGWNPAGYEWHSALRLRLAVRP